MLKPRRKPSSTAPLWPEKSCERSEVLKYGQICDQTAPTFAVSTEHNPPFPSDALQQLKHKKALVCKTFYIAKIVMPNSAAEPALTFFSQMFFIY